MMFLQKTPTNLHEQLPPSSIGICSNKARHKVYEYLHPDLRPDPDLVSDPDLIPVPELRPEPDPEQRADQVIKTETEDLEKNHYVFITKEINNENDIPDSVLGSDFEQKNEFIEKYEGVLQKDEFQENYDSRLLQEDDLPLSDLKEETDINDYSFELDSDNDDNDANFIIKNVTHKNISKPKKKITKVKSRAKSIKSKISQVTYEDDISLAVLIEKCGFDDKVVKARQKFLQNKAKLKERILEILESGQYDDLGDNIKMNKEIFIKIFNRYDKCDMRMLTIKPGMLIFYKLYYSRGYIALCWQNIVKSGAYQRPGPLYRQPSPSKRRPFLTLVIYCD